MRSRRRTAFSRHPADQIAQLFWNRWSSGSRLQSPGRAAGRTTARAPRQSKQRDRSANVARVTASTRWAFARRPGSTTAADAQNLRLQRLARPKEETDTLDQLPRHSNDCGERARHAAIMPHSQLPVLLSAQIDICGGQTEKASRACGAAHRSVLNRRYRVSDIGDGKDRVLAP